MNSALTQPATRLEIGERVAGMSAGPWLRGSGEGPAAARWPSLTAVPDVLSYQTLAVGADALTI
jgi:hypothetical protein